MTLLLPECYSLITVLISNNYTLSYLVITRVSPRYYPTITLLFSKYCHTVTLLLVNFRVKATVVGDWIHAPIPPPAEWHIHFSKLVIPYPFTPPLEKPRGGLLHPNPDLGARSPNADPLRDPQHGAAATLLQPAQPGVQQQGQQPLESSLHSQPHRLLLP